MMRKHWLPLGCAALLFLSSSNLCAQAAPQQPSPQLSTKPAPKSPPTPSKPVELPLDLHEPFTFVAFGDLRETETVNHTASDPDRRKEIISAITAVDPKFITVSGDLVLFGANESDWKQWDTETAEWKAKNIPVLPALGNHDLNGFGPAPLRNYFARFPELQGNRYYSAHGATIAVMMLDSSTNLNEGPQADWLKDELAHLPKTTEFVFFVLHHPPVTHSTDRTPNGGHSVRLNEQTFGAWLEKQQAASKAQFIVIAGHVHNYERYEEGGVTYLVSGGGGATPYEIPRKPDDFYKDPGPSYHYLRIYVNRGTVDIAMMKLDMNNGKAVWNQRDSAIVHSKFDHREKPIDPRHVPDK